MAGARLSALLLVVLLAAVPAAGADEEPHVTDPCGDTVLYAEGGGQVVSAPDPRDRRHDVRALWFTSVVDQEADEATYLGMDVTLQFCHPAALPAYDDHLAVSWDLDGELECSEYLDLFRQRVLGSLETILTARYIHACPGTLGHYFYFEHHLGAFRDVRVAGDTITWSLRLDLLPEHRRASLEPGTVWRSPRARTVGTYASGFNESVEAQVAGATVVAAVFRDDAGPGRDATVGG